MVYLSYAVSKVASMGGTVAPNIPYYSIYKEKRNPQRDILYKMQKPANIWRSK